jgi:hypothetical protein
MTAVCHFVDLCRIPLLRRHQKKQGDFTDRTKCTSLKVQCHLKRTRWYEVVKKMLRRVMEGESIRRME